MYDLSIINAVCVRTSNGRVVAAVDVPKLPLINAIGGRIGDVVATVGVSNSLYLINAIAKREGGVVNVFIVVDVVLVLLLRLVGF